MRIKKPPAENNARELLGAIIESDVMRNIIEFTESSNFSIRGMLNAKRGRKNPLVSAANKELGRSSAHSVAHRGAKVGLYSQNADEAVPQQRTW